MYEIWKLYFPHQVTQQSTRSHWLALKNMRETVNFAFISNKSTFSRFSFHQKQLLPENLINVQKSLRQRDLIALHTINKAYKFPITFWPNFGPLCERKKQWCAALSDLKARTNCLFIHPGLEILIDLRKLLALFTSPGVLHTHRWSESREILDVPLHAVKACIFWTFLIGRPRKSKSSSSSSALNHKLNIRVLSRIDFFSNLRMKEVETVTEADNFAWTPF